MRITFPIVVFFSSLIFLSRCGDPKPEFKSKENYSYLKKKKINVLLVLKVVLDIDVEKYNESTDKEIEKVLKNNYVFELEYRRALAKEFFKRDPKNRFYIDISEDAQDKSIEYQKFIGSNFPTELNKHYDLILELDILELLNFEYSYCNVNEKINLRLIDTKTNKLYLSSYTWRTIESIGTKFEFKKNLNFFKNKLTSLLNHSSPKIANYILNLEPIPDEDDILPYLKDVEQRDEVKIEEEKLEEPKEKKKKEKVSKSKKDTKPKEKVAEKDDEDFVDN